jgi:hypothetical protein
VTMPLVVCCGLLVPAASAAAAGANALTGHGKAGPRGKLSLLGTWTGHRERISSDQGYRNGTATLRVKRQIGLTFQGTMTWSTPQGPITEPVIAAYTPGGHLMTGADKNGMYIFSLVNRTTLDYCYVEHDAGYRTTCARLRKQKS